MSSKRKYTAPQEEMKNPPYMEASRKLKTEGYKNADLEKSGNIFSRSIQAIFKVLDLGLNVYSLLMQFIFTAIVFALLIYLWL